jgi:hypothetical protein
MHRFTDPEQHFNQSISQAAERYVTGLELAGLEPNETLTRAVAERAAVAASADYQAQARSDLRHNISEIQAEHQHRMKQIQRDGASLAVKTCPPIALVLSLIAWLNFSQPGGAVMGLVYAVGALVFLVMMVVAVAQSR